MPLSNFMKTAQTAVRKNSPVILTALGISGTITTAYLVGKASFAANDIIRAAEKGQPEQDKKERLKSRVKLVWKLYIPAGVSGIGTIGCIFVATKINNRRTAAIAAAYSLTEHAFIEYKDKVVEKIGANKEQALRDDIARDRILANKPSQEVLIIGAGEVLCCEMHTGRYFNSSMESLRKAQNDINAMLNNHDEATLSDFYYMLKLPLTTGSAYMGWKSDKQLALSFSTVLTEDNRPCIAFEYNYLKPT